jgi:8-oxo-dGTP diphosphatase
VALVVVRHARAGQRSEWEGDDRLRPLDKKGRKQAARLPDVLAQLEIRRIVSSPYLRCVQTVEPLAAARGLEVEPAPELGDQRAYAEGPALLAALLGADAVACVHGGIEHALGLDLRLRKGAVWLFRETLERPEILVD